VTFEIGIHLGNAHPSATARSVIDLAIRVEELGLDAVWMTEHIVVAGDEAHRYANVIHPVPALSYLAARTSRVWLGTSVVVAPLHDPFLLAKLAAGIQALSGNRLRLGLGAGWYEPEFRYMNRSMAGRGRRMDEAIALMRALWAGERAFEGEFYRCDDARFGPLPEVAPDIWIGGKSRAAASRAARLEAVWHPIELTPEEVAEAKAQWPDLRIVPRATAGDVASLAELIEGMRAAGADGVAAGLTLPPDEAARRLEALRERLAPA
jgi:probable F420-dependent oxidoreductase